MPARRRHVLVPVLSAVATACAPAAAWAQAPHGGTEAAAPRAPEVASASAGAVSVSTRAGALLERTTRFRGTVPAEDGGRTVTIERLDELTGQWSAIARAVAREDGHYAARWRTDRVGRHDIRARVESPGAAAASAAPRLAVTVYRAATATWYGPGFYGRRTACGQKLTRTLQGVAHRRLRCGTRVTIFHAGRSITVPVVDRGPFNRGVRWDLTAATAQAVAFEGRAVVGVQPAPRPAPAGQPSR